VNSASHRLSSDQIELGPGIVDSLDEQISLDGISQDSNFAKIVVADHFSTTEGQS
jgi:hypothetical protein